MPSSMIERCIRPDRIPVLVDLGYVNDKATRSRGDELLKAGVSQRNFSIEGFGRLLVKLPTKRAKNILAQFPIDEGTTYFQTTHHWRGLKDRPNE